MGIVSALFKAQRARVPSRDFAKCRPFRGCLFWKLTTQDSSQRGYWDLFKENGKKPLRCCV